MSLPRSCKQSFEHDEVVERHHVRVAFEELRHAERHRDGRRHLAPAHDVRVRHHGEHHLVVVAVVRALDLHDVVATGRRARDADRAHRRLGARVREAHLLELEAPAQLFGEEHHVLGRCREVRARLRRARDRFDDLRVRMADDHATEAAVRVDVLVAVDVPDLRAVAFAEVDRIRVAGLERRTDTLRQAVQRALVERLRLLRAVEEAPRLGVGDVVGRAVMGSMEIRCSSA